MITENKVLTINNTKQERNMLPQKKALSIPGIKAVTEKEETINRMLSEKKHLQLLTSIWKK